jgi:uncharacterized RDD family membrane protein YckC
MTATAEPTLGLTADMPGEGAVRYAGLATRVIAFAVDAALIDLAALVVAAAGALISSLLHFPNGLQNVLVVIGAGAFVLWSVAYFVAFWSTTGQTPGARVMQIRVLTAGGERVGPKRALLRCVGVVLAALPLFLGFVRILFDAKRRGFQDRLAATVVVATPQLSVAQARRVERRAAYDGVRQRRPIVPR